MRKLEAYWVVGAVLLTCFCRAGCCVVGVALDSELCWFTIVTLVTGDSRVLRSWKSFFYNPLCEGPLSSIITWYHVLCSGCVQFCALHALRPKAGASLTRHKHAVKTCNNFVPLLSSMPPLPPPLLLVRGQVPNMAIMMLSYELISDWLRRRDEKNAQGFNNLKSPAA